ncbi:hypothetical protein HZH66_011052 [Vespula vulgaris]|uniref:Uncharacterized protein n=1 Tax=Vespula vulgaris TaxID=7454 RepID=A0A834MW28_VESVU|nr:hypothetical protein HZH66_011052 [Vespula vulgaris]
MRNTDSTVFSRPVREWYVRADQYILVRFIELTLTRVAGSITIQITAEVFVESSINGSQLDRALSPTTFRIILARDASLELSALQRAEDTGVITYDMGTNAPHRDVRKDNEGLIEAVVEEKGKRDKEKASASLTNCTQNPLVRLPSSVVLALIFSLFRHSYELSKPSCFRDTFRVALALFIFVCKGPPLPLITLSGTTNKKFTEYHLWLFGGSAYLELTKTIYPDFSRRSILFATTIDRESFQ